MWRIAFPRFEDNREHMLRVIRNHRRAAHNATDFEGVTTQVLGIDPDLCPPDLLSAARSAWDIALSLGERHGYRNAQVSTLAPTGTIGLVMDCDTTGVEPDFALVKFKKLAGGGHFKIANKSLAPSLRRLGYSPGQIQDILAYVVGTSSLTGAPHVNRETLAAQGFTPGDLAKVEAALPGAFELGYAFNAFVLGEDALDRLGFSEKDYAAVGFDLLADLGFSEEQIARANDAICGLQTIEGAPHLRDEHLPVFDCANPQRQVRKALHPPYRPYQDAGRHPAVHLRRHLQDHQHAQRSVRRGRGRRLHDVLGTRPQGNGTVPGRLQGLTAALRVLGRRGFRGDRRRRYRGAQA